MILYYWPPRLGETDIDHGSRRCKRSIWFVGENKSGDYAFKHALVRDALYNSLLSDARMALHLKIAEEIERRSDNRLTEVTEILAHHYGHTDRVKKAFAYLSMSGSKSLGVYSLDEATKYFTATLALIDKKLDCASDDQLADFLVPYSLLLNMLLRSKMMIEVRQRYLKRIDRLGDDARVVLIHHHFVFALLWSARYSEAVAAQRANSLIASRLGDSLSKAYALAGEIYASTLADTPMPLHAYEALKRELMIATSETSDAYIQSWARFVIGWEEIHRGRMIEAQNAARELMQVGQRLNDPRTTGFGLAVLSWIALTSDSYVEALKWSDQSF